MLCLQSALTTFSTSMARASSLYRFAAFDVLHTSTALYKTLVSGKKNLNIRISAYEKIVLLYRRPNGLIFFNAEENPIKVV